MGEVNHFEVKDYLSEARGRYTQQFTNKDVFDRYVQLLIYGQTQLQAALKDLMQNRSLDTATGVQLDTIGELVGLERGSLPAVAWVNSYFGFFDDAAAKPLADLTVANDAGIFLDLASQTEGNVQWTDEVYRIFLKAKIFANTSNGTPEELITATKMILNVTYVDLIELGNARLLIGFDRLLTDVEKYILQTYGEGAGILPVPIGVGVEYLEVDGDFFGFEETPGALGFASFEPVATPFGYGESYGFGYGGSSVSTTELVGGGNFASLIE